MTDNIEKFDLFKYEQNFSCGRCIISDDADTICLFETDDGFGKKIEPNTPDSICTQILYYPDTLTMSSIGYYIKGWNIEVGVWRDYDKFGALVGEYDMDKNYPVKWKEMKALFAENGLDNDKITTLKRQKNRINGKYEWVLSYLTSERVCETISFDATTGLITERIEEKL